MIKELVSVANSLDKKGFIKEADLIDNILKKIAQTAQPAEVIKYVVKPGDNMTKITESISLPVNKSLQDNLDLNPGLNPNLLKPGQILQIWGPAEYETPASDVMGNV